MIKTNTIDNESSQFKIQNIKQAQLCISALEKQGIAKSIEIEKLVNTLSKQIQYNKKSTQQFQRAEQRFINEINQLCLIRQNLQLSLQNKCREVQEITNEYINLKRYFESKPKINQVMIELVSKLQIDTQQLCFSLRNSWQFNQRKEIGNEWGRQWREQIKQARIQFIKGLSKPLNLIKKAWKDRRSEQQRNHLRIAEEINKQKKEIEQLNKFNSKINDQLNEKIKLLNKQNKMFQNELNQQIKKIQQLQQGKVRCQKQIGYFQKQINSLKSQNIKLRQTIKQLQCQNSSIVQDIEQLHSLLLQSKSQIQSIYQYFQQNITFQHFILQNKTNLISQYQKDISQINKIITIDEQSNDLDKKFEKIMLTKSKYHKLPSGSKTSHSITLSG